MNYIVESKNSVIKNIYFPADIVGLEIKTQNKIGKSKMKKIIIVDISLSTVYIKRIIVKKINKLIFLINKILNSDDTPEGDTIIVLDEIQKLKSMIIVKYKQFLTTENYKDMLRRIILIENEFKSNYTSKMFLQNIMNYSDEDQTEFMQR